MNRIEEIKARCEAATKGPWIKINDQLRHGVTAGLIGVIHVYDEDADFIAHSREDIPFLLAELDRLTEAQAGEGGR